MLLNVAFYKRRMPKARFFNQDKFVPSQEGCMLENRLHLDNRKTQMLLKMSVAL